MPLEFKVKPGYIFSECHQSPLSNADIWNNKHGEDARGIAYPTLETKGTLDDFVLYLSDASKLVGDVPAAKIKPKTLTISQFWDDGLLYFDGEAWTNTRPPSEVFGQHMSVVNGIPQWKDDRATDKPIQFKTLDPPSPNLTHAYYEEDGQKKPIWVQAKYPEDKKSFAELKLASEQPETTQ